MSDVFTVPSVRYLPSMQPQLHTCQPVSETQSVILFRPNETIIAEAKPATVMYRLVSGMARSYNSMTDGRRHISAFLSSGDVFGFEVGSEYQLSVDAVTECKLVKLRRLSAEDSLEATELCHYAMRSLAKAQTHAQTLGCLSATQRLAAFLLHISALQCNDAVVLPMPRQDIADYLGSTVETVSRGLAQFEREGVIKLASARRIRLLNKRALRAV